MPTRSTDSHNMAKRYRAVLRRRNGRFIKATRPMSKYQAKKAAERYDQTHDQEFYAEIEPCEGENKWQEYRQE